MATSRAPGTLAGARQPAWLTLDTCPDKTAHTPAPSTYIAWHAWARAMARRHHQVRCPTCGLWAVWVAGRPEPGALLGPQRHERLVKAALGVLAAGQGNLKQPLYDRRVQAFDDLRDVLEELGQW